MKKPTMLLIVILCLMLVPVFPANAGLINFEAATNTKNNWFRFPRVAVKFEDGGLTALLSENGRNDSVFLENDPGFGDPEVIIPAPGSQFLNFEYSFLEGESLPEKPEYDRFEAFLFDADAKTSFGAYQKFGDRHQFVTETTSSGSITFDLSEFLSPGAPTLGLHFDLSRPDGSLDKGRESTVAISNLRFESGPPALRSSTPVPEPATIILVATGLVGLFGLRKRKVGEFTA